MSEYSISTDYLNVLNAKVNNLHDFVTRSSTSTSSTPESSISIFKLMCIAVILFFLGYTIYTYLDKQGVFEDDTPEPTEDSSKPPKTESNKSKSNTNNANIQNLKYTVKNLNKKQVRFENDNTNNNLQNNKKSKGGQFCYLGSDRGFRSCAKLQDNQECESQKLFPTMEMCVNPQLRYT